MPLVRSAALAAIILGLTAPAYAQPTGGPPPEGRGPDRSQAVELDIADSFDLPEADAHTTALVEAANAFLDTLTDEQRETATFAFDDAEQRGRWSNFPDSLFSRDGLARGEMDDTQRAALDRLLSTLMSARGMENIRYQLAADDSLVSEGRLLFSSDAYFVSFLGEPSTDQPWMMQFGGHHLAINATVAGSEISYSPMLTGGQPLQIEYEGQQIYITADETAAAQAFLDSLDEDQRATAIRGDQLTQLVLGPGDDGATLAPEGVQGADLTDQQKELLLDVIGARMGMLATDEYAAKMETARSEIDDTWFAWWGPTGTLGAGYFRVVSPSIAMEYAPQELGGDPTDHAHNMYRDPQNDYGVKWITAQ